MTWQNPEQLFVAQVLIKNIKLQCCGNQNKYITNVLIYDMFAGSGMDAMGNYGSPLILLQEAKGENKQYCTFLSKQNAPQVYFGFNELLTHKEVELESNIQGVQFCVPVFSIKNNVITI